jgi:hypothetical protein
MGITWRRRATMGGLAVVTCLVPLVPSAAAPQRTAKQDESTGSPTQGIHTLIFQQGTGSGGAIFRGLGTVSHASIDNRFASVLEGYRNDVLQVTTPRLEVRRSSSRLSPR